MNGGFVSGGAPVNTTLHTNALLFLQMTPAPATLVALPPTPPSPPPSTTIAAVVATATAAVTPTTTKSAQWYKWWNICSLFYVGRFIFLFSFYECMSTYTIERFFIVFVFFRFSFCSYWNYDFRSCWTWNRFAFLNIGVADVIRDVWIVCMHEQIHLVFFDYYLLLTTVQNVTKCIQLYA